MKDKAVARRRWIKFGLIFGGWTLFGLFFTSQEYIRMAYAGRPIDVRRLFVAWLGSAYVWAVLTPFVFNLARRFPLESGRLSKNIPIHVAASVFFSLLELLVFVLIAPYLGMPPLRDSFSAFLMAVIVVDFHFNLLTYWAILGICVVLDYYRRYREREMKAYQLEARLAQAQLQVLKMQLHPHFLFNTLHAISTLMHRDVEAADRMIARLSDLLRISLETVGVQEVPLKQELELLEKYLEIEQTRFRDRLGVEIKVEPETLDARVPNLILQPLVENAIRHGIVPRAAPGRIEIHAWRENGTLQLEVRDNGRGLPTENQETLKEGLGLSNTRARLRQLYGAEHRFSLCNAPAGGLVVSLAIPFSESAKD
jgi:signal transduction histidine kinase